MGQKLRSERSTQARGRGGGGHASEGLNSCSQTSGLHSRSKGGGGEGWSVLFCFQRMNKLPSSFLKK